MEEEIKKKDEEPPKPKVLTVEMVRKRSEHNDGVLSTLEEIAMHQDEIGVLTNVLERYCPHLRILYLQNNYIEKIQFISKLKELEYLNMALNNVEIIEGLEGCESLNKLDLTCNFIVDILCINVLKENAFLKELHLIGNPCDRFEGYRDYVVGVLPNLKMLDGQEVTPTDRIRAKRNFAMLESKMIEQIASYKPTHYTPEERLAAWREIEMKKKENSPPEKPDPRDATFHKIKKPAAGPDENGKIMQCNMGKWNFKWKVEGDYLSLDVAIGRYLDVSQITVDVNPTWIRVEAKEKVLQLILPHEVFSDQVEAFKSETTGHLVVKMKVVSHEPFIALKQQDKST